jgi:hypothetical protein
MEIINNNSVKLCCGGNGCPIVEDIGNGMVKVTDDNGASITIKKEELDLASNALQVLKNNADNLKDSDEKLILG